MKRFLWISGLVLVLAGIGLTLFLTWAHFNGSLGHICGEGSACQSVLTSEYATVAGLPTALYGLIFYVFFFSGILAYPLTHEQGESFVLNTLLGLSGTAFVVSVLLMSYSMIGLSGFCFYCGISFGLVTLLFMGTLFWRIRGAREGEFSVSSITSWQGLTAGLAVLLVVMIGVSIHFYGQQPQQSSESKTLREARLLAYDSRSVGSPNAPIRVVEFFDLECPACQQFTNQVFPKIKRQYIDTGEVLWTFRFFPLPRHHKHALEAHTALSMVPPSDFLDAKKNIMENTNRWVSRSVNDPQPFLRGVLSNYGLGEATFSDRMRDHLLKQRNGYAQFGIQSTPSFMVNGELVTGGRPITYWQQLFSEIGDE